MSSSTPILTWPGLIAGTSGGWVAVLAHDADRRRPRALTTIQRTRRTCGQTERASPSSERIPTRQCLFEPGLTSFPVLLLNITNVAVTMHRPHRGVTPGRYVLIRGASPDTAPMRAPTGGAMVALPCQ